MINKIICGDHVKVMKSMPENYIDLTVTSPPYDKLRKYNGFGFDFESMADQLFRVTKKGGAVVWVVGDATIKGSETGTSFKQALYFKKIGFNLHDTMIWEKPWTNYGCTKSRYAGGWEYMFILSKGKPKTINIIRDRKNVTAGKGRSMRSDRRVTGDNQGCERSDNYITHDYGPRKGIWVIPVGGKKCEEESHPAPFPEKLANDHIISWSNAGDLIFDPMCGRGTTPQMAKLNNRNYIGVDISKKYCDMSENRINNQ